ncbi:MAG: energy-coupling factor transporter transmembrane component T [Promethearchaeota archaeon]
MGIVSSVFHHFSEFLSVDNQVRSKNQNATHPSIKIIVALVVIAASTQFFTIKNFILLTFLLFVITIVVKGFKRLFFEPFLFLFVFSLISTLFYFIFFFKDITAELSSPNWWELIFLDGTRLNYLVKFNLRLIASLWISRLLMFTTPFPEFNHGLKKLRIPKTFINLLSITIRYIYLISEEFTRITIANELRAPNVKSFKKRFEALSKIYASMLNRAIKRSNNVYLAMKLRGNPNNFIMKTLSYSRVKSLLFLSGSIIMFILAFFPW